MQLAARFASIAACVDERRPEAATLELLAQTAAACAEAARVESSPATKQLLANVETAVSAWHQVWPRLGAQGEFRLAVAREARLWSKRLSELAQAPS